RQTTWTTARYTLSLHDALPIWKKKQTAARKEGRWIGLGIGSTLDSGTNNFGQARIINPDAPFSGQSKVGIVKLDIYGEVVVSMGSVPQGQGHETAAAQVVADALGITPDLVNVMPSASATTCAAAVS